MIRLRNYFQMIFTLLLFFCPPAQTGTTSDRSDRIALFDAVDKDDISQVKTLIAAGADVNARMSDGTTALLLASQKGNKEIVQELIAAGTDVNAKRNNGLTALMMGSQGHCQCRGNIDHAFPVFT